MAVVRNYTHMSEDELWEMTPSRMRLEYFMANKAIILNAKLIGAAMMGALE